jgi:hypothetical protein
VSWTDDFSDSSLDSALFGTSVAGAGSVAEGAATLTISGGAATTDAALVYLKAKIDQAINETCTHKVRATAINAGGYVELLIVVDKASAPAVAAAATIVPQLRIGVRMSAAGNIYLYYYDTAGTVQWWTGSAFSATVTVAHAGAVNTWYTVQLVHTTTQFQLVLLDAAGTTELARTSLVNFSALKSTYANLYVCWGDQYTDFYYADTESDFFSLLSDETIAAADSLGVSLTESSSVAAITIIDVADSITVSFTDTSTLGTYTDSLTDSWDVLTYLSDLFLDTWIVTPVVQSFEFTDSWDVLSASGMSLTDSWRVLKQTLDPDTGDPINVATLYGGAIHLPTGSVGKT